MNTINGLDAEQVYVEDGVEQGNGAVGLDGFDVDAGDGADADCQGDGEVGAGGAVV